MQRDWLTTLPYTTTMYPAIFLRPLSSTRSYALPTYLPFYLFLLRCYTFKHTHTYMCELGTTRVTHKHSFLSRFLFIDPLPPTPSFNLTLFIRLRPSVNSCLSFSPPLLLPFLHFQSTTEQTTVPGNASISSYLPPPPRNARSHRASSPFFPLGPASRSVLGRVYSSWLGE